MNPPLSISCFLCSSTFQGNEPWKLERHILSLHKEIAHTPLEMVCPRCNFCGLLSPAQFFPHYATHFRWRNCEDLTVVDEIEIVEGKPREIEQIPESEREVFFDLEEKLCPQGEDLPD